MVSWQKVVSALLFEPMLLLQLKIAAVVGFALLLDATSRALSPSFRHTLWSAVVVTIVLLPLLERIAPPIPWVSSVLPSESAAAHEESGGWRTARPTGLVASGADVEPLSPVPTVAAADSVPADSARPLDYAVPVDFAAPVDSPVLIDSPARDSLFAAASAGPWLWIYLAGFLSLGLRRVWAMTSVWRVSGRATRVRENAVDIETWRAADTLELPRIPVVLRSLEIRSAYTWGWLKPRVLVPESSRDWGESRWHAVLLHELSHVRGGDWFRLVLGELVRCVYWFNPAVWIALKRLSVEREHACDASVLQHGVKPSDYAAHLLEVARCQQQERRLEAVALSARGGGFEKRIEAILDRNLVLRSPKTLSVFGVGLLLSVSTAFAAVSPEADVTRALPLLSEAMSRPTFLPMPPPAPLPPSTDDLDEGMPVAPAAPLRPSAGDLDEPIPLAPPVPAAPPAPVPGSVSAPIAPVPPPPPIPFGAASTMGPRGDGGHQRTDVQWHSDEGRFRFRDDGIRWGLERETEELRIRVRFDFYKDIELNGAKNAVNRLGPDSRIVLETRVNGGRHRLEIDADVAGKPSYTWRVGTEVRAFDAQARSWMRATLDAINAIRDVNRLRGARASLQGRIASIRGQEASMRARIASARGHAASLRGQMASVRGQMASRRGHVASIRGEIASIDGHRSVLRSKLRALEQRTLSKEAQASRREAIQRQMAKLQRRAQRLDEKAEAYHREAEKAVAAAKRRIAETARKLEAFDVDGKVKRVERELKDFDSAARIREVEEEIEKISDRDIASSERKLPRALERVTHIARSIQ